MTVESKELAQRPYFAEKLELILQTVRSHINDGEAPPVVFLANLDENGVPTDEDMVDASDYHTSELGKEALSYVLDESMRPGSPINALIYVSEAWVTKRAKTTPSEDPDRTEALVVIMRVPGEAQTLIYNIDRKAGTLTPHEFMDEGNFGGRMTGIDSPEL